MRMLSLHTPLLPTLLLLALLCPATTRADIAIIVHPQNPLTELSEADLKKIFLGRLPLFPQSRQEIHPLDLPEWHPTFIDFYQRLLQLDGIKLKRYRAYYLFSGRGRLPTATTSESDLISRVANDPAAIGYLDASQPRDQVHTLLMLRTSPRPPPAPTPADTAPVPP